MLYDPVTDPAHLALSGALHHIYETMEGSEEMMAYSERHTVNSAAVLTVFTDETADLVARSLRPRIEGKTVVEIGGGIGLLAFHLGLYAKRVYCIEANPMWGWTFATLLLKRKPVNVSYLFGSAQEFVGKITGDVALFCTHSDASGMKIVGRGFAGEVIDVYREIVQEIRPDLMELRDMPMMEAEAALASIHGAGNEQGVGS